MVTTGISEDFKAYKQGDNKPHELSPDCGVKKNLIREIQAIHQELKQKGLYKELVSLQKPSLIKALVVIVGDWLCILLAWWMTVYIHITFLPVAIFIVGTRQRALGNIFHDAGHLVLDRVRWRNNLVSDLLLACPLFNLTSYYWKVHRCHHVCLGASTSDPDFIQKDEYYEWPWHRILLDNVFSWPTWRGSIWGYLPYMSIKDRMKVVAWWFLFLSVLYWLTDLYGSGLFLAIWLIAKASIFHVITTFREISDHVGLEPGSLIGFTRNNPTAGIGRVFLHPHNNGYHLTHHLAYRVPFFNLPKAHALLMNVDLYASGHHCDGYFGGHYPVIASWTGNYNSQLEREQ